MEMVMQINTSEVSKRYRKWTRVKIEGAATLVGDLRTTRKFNLSYYNLTHLAQRVIDNVYDSSINLSHLDRF